MEINRSGENLPSVIKKEKNLNFFNKMLNNYYKNRDLKKAGQIIAVLEKNKEYGTYSMAAFRQLVSKEIEKNPNGYIHSMDINDLYIANKQNKDRKQVNKDIKSLIDKVNEIVNISNPQKAYIAKLGDEIYVYQNGIDDKTAIEQNEKFKAINSGILTLSSGMTSNLQGGLERSLKDADKSMYEDKIDRKHKKIVEFCGEDLSRIINYTIDEQLNKCRTDLKKLKTRTMKMKLINTYDTVLNKIDIDKLISEVNEKEIGEENKEDKYLTRIKKFEDEARSKYVNISDEEVQKYALAKMLSTGNFKDTISNEYFQEFEKDKVEKEKDYELIAIDISGLKYVNDKFGHEEGDKQIQNVIDGFQNILDENGITKLSSVVVKGAGNAFVAVKKLDHEKKKSMIESIETMQNNVDEKKRLSIQCDIVGDGDKSKKINNGKDNFDILLSIAEENLEKKSLNAKITSQEQVERLIKQIYISIFNNDIIQVAIRNGKFSKEEIESKINNSFRSIVKKEREESSLKSVDELDKSKDIADKQKNKERDKDKLK